MSCDRIHHALRPPAVHHFNAEDYPMLSRGKDHIARLPSLILASAVLVSAVVLSTSAPAQTSFTEPAGQATSIPHAQPGRVPLCEVQPVVIPQAAPIPGLAELDPATGLHYTGSGEVVLLDPEDYRLEVSGLVDHPLSLRYDQLRCLPKIERRTTIVCKGNFEDTFIWAGASLRYLLEIAAVKPPAKDIVLTSADGYTAEITIADAMDERAFLAYEWEGRPVPIIHGFPVRAALPGRPGANWVKWLIKLEVK